jgi:hypothetical protein
VVGAKSFFPQSTLYSSYYNNTLPYKSGFTSSWRFELREESESVLLKVKIFLADRVMLGLRRIHEFGYRRCRRGKASYENDRREQKIIRQVKTVSVVVHGLTRFTGQILLKGDNVSLIQSLTG